MPTRLTVGDVTVTAIRDGSVHLPPMYYPGLDFARHPELIQPDGTYHFPAGCFVIQGEGFTILVDAGIGPMAIPFPAEIAAEAGLEHPPEHIAAGGALPERLAELGIAPEDVTMVFLTHLDADHVGWVAPSGSLTFPNAEVVCSAIELAKPPGPAPGEAEGREGLAIAAAAGLLREISGPESELAPGVTALFAPGHTPGQYIVRVVSQGRELRLLADAVHHPLQLDDAGISFLLEATPDHALRTREALLSELEGRDVPVNMCHFPGLEFQLIAVEDGHRRWVTA